MDFKYILTEIRQSDVRRPKRSEGILNPDLGMAIEIQQNSSSAMPFQKLNQKIMAILPAEKWTGHSMILGVSGGADSVAMLRLFHHLAQESTHRKFFACHANHHLRGQESDEDQLFVQKLCQQLNVPLEIVSLPAQQPVSDGVESHLRNMRYQMFEEMAAKLGARYVMTAHNADDQAETILFRILRGTGIAGLAGIPSTRPLCDGVSVIRPMLNITRDEILDFLKSIGQGYRNDSSNQSNDYTRNKIRNQLVPLIQTEFDCKIVERLRPLSQQALEQQRLLDSISEPVLDSASRFLSNSFVIERGKLGDLPAIVLRHLLVTAWKRMDWPMQDMTFEKWNQLAQQIRQTNKKGQPSKQMLPGKIEFSLDENEVRFSKD